MCLAVGTLFFTGSSVERGAVMMGRDELLDAKTLRLILARCAKCKARIRVLPRELLAYKSFSLPVIEAACARYVDPAPQGPGLRKTVCTLGKYAPAHTTLWRWLAGLGERALDRGAAQTVRAYASQPPAAALVAESAKRLGQGLRRVWDRCFAIPFWKYHSQKRREQLEGCARVLEAARRLFPKSSTPLSVWHGWLLARFSGSPGAGHVAAWSFPTGIPCTAMQLTLSLLGAVESAAKAKKHPGDHRDEARAPP